MSGGAGNDEADGGSRLPAQSDAEQGRFGKGVEHDRWALDERGVWRERRRTAGSRPSRSPAQSDVEQEGVGQAGQREEQWALDEHGVWRERPQTAGSRPPRSRRSRLKLGGAGRLAVVGAAVVAFVLVLGLAGVFGSNNAAATGGFQPKATKPAAAARQTAQAFLAAWRSGDIQKAASYTDRPAAATATLNSYRNGLHLQALQLSVQSATAQGKVAFATSATVGLASTSAVTATWSYASVLDAYAKDGRWWVRWNPALVAPNLTAGERVIAVPVAASAGEVLDAAGGNLQNATDPGLVNIAAALAKSASSGQGTPGIQLAFVGSGNTAIAGTTDLLRQPVSPNVKTSIDPRVEAAAQSAVQDHSDSSMVVIQPSTGDILAVANNDGANDFALTARVAPGSTNKIITSTALLATGLVRSPSQPVECPPQIDADGEVINNAGGESEPAGTPFLMDFAASCNNAFDRWYASLGPQTLAQTAQKYYGLNQPWNIGIGSGVPYYIIPARASEAELALELFGQGRLEASPLAMASVAATVDSGSFRQPIVVLGQRQLGATPLPAHVHQDLWQLMRAVTQPGGTAAGVFDGVGSAVYAKTGTADVGGQGQPNSWMVAFDPALNVAIGCVVLDSGYGAEVAGPEVAAVLQQLR